MDALTTFGLFAVTAMLVCYAVEDRSHLCSPCQEHREHDMGLRIWLFVVLAGGLAHLILSLADREISAGVDRLTETKFTHPNLLDTDPDVKLVNERSPYMRNER